MYSTYKDTYSRHFEGDEFHVRTEKTLEEVSELAKAAYEYFAKIEGVQVYRKRK